MTRLQLNSLGKSFDHHIALQAIDLDIGSGEMIALLGPSGCGKTTLLRTIAGLEMATTGTILFDGRDVTDLEIQQRNTGMVFQRYALFPHMSVEKNIRFGLTVRNMPRAEQDQRLEEILEVVQLGDFRDRFPAQLSGGQMQRVALARTLVTRPSILMLDEPFANLDTNLRSEMRSFIKTLQAHFNITTIFVTHDQSEAMEIADRIAIIFDGRIAQFDSPDTLYHNPVNPDVARFMGGANILEGTMANDNWLATPVGRLKLDVPKKLKSGTPAQVMIRNESLTLHDQDPGNHALAGIIEDARFFGASTNFCIDINGNKLNATVQAGQPRAIGSPVWLTVEPDKIWLFPNPNSSK